VQHLGHLSTIISHSALYWYFWELLYTHVTSDMQKQASGIVGSFMEDLFGKELKPWQESESPAREP